MRDAEFKQWLAGEGLVPISVSTRLTDVRRLEKEFGDLDDFSNDELDNINAKLTPTPDNPNPAGIVIDGNVKDGLSTLRSALASYRRFLANPSGTGHSQADQIRQFVLREYVEPARRNGETSVAVISGDVHRRMALENAMPAVCSALDRRKFADLASVKLADRSGPAHSSTVRFQFELLPVSGSWAEQELRRRYGNPS